ncbi:MAG: GNAT family N-acetyltransferase [Phenylobacterium sp.]|nr:MAG: GNAT family N-acetyltransferase [Phenylobacterium sp.]
MLDALEIEALERAIVASVAPERVIELDGWLVPIDDGDIGRAKSAVPLRHVGGPAPIAAIEEAYRRARRPAAFRLAETQGLIAARAELLRRGYAAHTPTIMKTGTASGLIALGGQPGEVVAAPDAGWIAAFSGEGFDRAESAARVRNLSRSPDALFGAVREGDRTLAVGVITFGGGWAGIHGMRTAPDRRKEGLASRVLSALGRAAATRGVERVFLQVKEDNPARSLYRKAGFELAWRYQYWAR